MLGALWLICDWLIDLSGSGVFLPLQANAHVLGAQWLIYDWLIDWLIDWLTDWLTDWLIDWLLDWLVDWLTPCRLRSVSKTVSQPTHTGSALIDFWFILDWLTDWLPFQAQECFYCYELTLACWERSDWSMIDWLIDWLICQAQECFFHCELTLTCWERSDWSWLIDWLIDLSGSGVFLPLRADPRTLGALWFAGAARACVDDKLCVPDLNGVPRGHARVFLPLCVCVCVVCVCVCVSLPHSLAPSLPHSLPRPLARSFHHFLASSLTLPIPVSFSPSLFSLPASLSPPLFPSIMPLSHSAPSLALLSFSFSLYSSPSLSLSYSLTLPTSLPSLPSLFLSLSQSHTLRLYWHSLLHTHTRHARITPNTYTTHTHTHKCTTHPHAHRTPTPHPPSSPEVNKDTSPDLTVHHHALSAFSHRSTLVIDLLTSWLIHSSIYWLILQVSCTRTSWSVLLAPPAPRSGSCTAAQKVRVTSGMRLLVWETSVWEISGVRDFRYESLPVWQTSGMRDFWCERLTV